MTKLKCKRCDTLNPPHARYRMCISCQKPLFDAELVDV